MYFSTFEKAVDVKYFRFSQNYIIFKNISVPFFNELFERAHVLFGLGLVICKII